MNVEVFILHGSALIPSTSDAVVRLLCVCHPAGDAAANVPTELLVDTSIPEEPAHPVNPFTSATLLEDDERPVPKVCCPGVSE